MAPVTRAVLASLTLLFACAIERGKQWGPPIVPGKSPVPEVSLVLLGDTGARGRGGVAVAAELQRVLGEHRRVGRPAVVLWLGDNIGPVGPGELGKCTPKHSFWQAPGPAALAAVVRAHAAEGGAVLAALGEQDWRCGQPELELQAEVAAGPHPWAMPAHNYVARVYPDGHVRYYMSCSAGTCTPPAPAADDGPDPLVELVIVDSAAWLAPPPAGTPEAARADASLAEQAQLLAALAARPVAWPRLLVSHHPLESAGPHGVGGLYSDSGYFLHSEPVRRAVDAGLFAGALSAHDRMVLATADITPATKRSSRFWLKHPVFQVISGATSKPDSRAGARGAWYFQGTALRAELHSNRLGFAELYV
ncbi:MAG TPA: hypothetical protein VIK91_26845, partial [Nannocystis sp.]